MKGGWGDLRLRKGAVRGLTGNLGYTPDRWSSRLRVLSVSNALQSSQKGNLGFRL
jgi:hypothetical protein